MLDLRLEALQTFNTIQVVPLLICSRSDMMHLQEVSDDLEKYHLEKH